MLIGPKWYPLMQKVVVLSRLVNFFHFSMCNYIIRLSMNSTVEHLF